MSRSLERHVRALEREAQRKVAVIRRVVYEYNKRLDVARDSQAGPVVIKQREIDHEIAEYVKLYKSLRRARKRLQTKVA